MCEQIVKESLTFLRRTVSNLNADSQSSFEAINGACSNANALNNDFEFRQN